MDVRGWLADSTARIRADGLDGLRASARPAYHKALQGVTWLRDPGISVYDREWDLLVVVDACRLDLMREVAPGYGFAGAVGAVRSLDSATLGWMRKTFSPARADETAETAYVCGNPFSATALDPADFGALEEVWRDVWTEPGTVAPRAITDRTVALARERDPDRLIAHYMQPHCPFLSRPGLSRGKRRDRFGDQSWPDVWERLRAGDLDRETVWAGYRENLALALDEVELLLANVDADRAVVTSDHGNALGEWLVYGHPPGLPLDSLRTVPWIETTARDGGGHEPALGRWRDGATVDREDQLAALGYV